MSMSRLALQRAAEQELLVEERALPVQVRKPLAPLALPRHFRR
jgi:hypothetical protein